MTIATLVPSTIGNVRRGRSTSDATMGSDAQPMYAYSAPSTAGAIPVSSPCAARPQALVAVAAALEAGCANAYAAPAIATSVAIFTIVVTETTAPLSRVDAQLSAAKPPRNASATSVIPVRWNGPSPATVSPTGTPVMPPKKIAVPAASAASDAGAIARNDTQPNARATGAP